LIIRKIIKITAARRLKFTKFDYRRMSVRPSVCFWYDRRVAATSTRRDGGDRGGRCWCAKAVRVSLSVCPSVS